MPYFSGSDVRMLASGLAVSYRNRKHQLCVSSQVSYVAVQRDVFLCRTGFADGERHSQDGVGSELSCRTGRQGFCVKLWVHCWFALINMNFYFNLQIVFVLVIIFKVFGVQLSLISLWLTFVFCSVHLDHHVVQLLLLHHADSLSTRTVRQISNSLTWNIFAEFLKNTMTMSHDYFSQWASLSSHLQRLWGQDPECRWCARLPSERLEERISGGFVTVSVNDH